MSVRDHDLCRITKGARGRGRSTARLVLTACALAVTTTIATAGPAASAECSGALMMLRLCGTAPTVTTPPTTAAPVLVATPVPLPPVTLPPVTLPPVMVAPPAPLSTPDAARRLLDLVNGERQRAGLGQLSSREDIAAIALAHSERMAGTGDIFHSDSFFGAAVKSQLNATARGENVAYNGDIDNAHSRLMASPGHRANILDGRFTTAGFGVVRHADGRYFITQNFIQAAGAPRAAAPVAAPSANRPTPRAPAAPKPAAPKPAPAAPAAAAPVPTTVVAPPPVPEEVPAFAVLQATDTPAAAASLKARPVSKTSGVGGAAPVTAVALLTLAGSACWLAPRRRVS